MFVDLVQAVPGDGVQILRLRRSLEEWLSSKGVAQWDPGEVSLSDVDRQVAANEWYVLREGDSLVGALRLLWSDEPVWPADNVIAAYVHGLMVDRDHEGQNVGAELLRWAEHQARMAGASELRLDCSESNSRLRAYYTARDFSEVGRRDFTGALYSAVLLTKTLSQEDR